VEGIVQIIKGTIMTAVHQQNYREKLRAKHHSWATTGGDCKMFRHVVTLDPHGTQQVWDDLSVSTPVVEFQALPVRLHRALVTAICESEALKRKKAPLIVVEDEDEEALQSLRCAGL
jgi:hypothetical protein